MKKRPYYEIDLKVNINKIELRILVVNRSRGYKNMGYFI